MNNKYQEALDNYSENVDYRDYSTKTVDIVNESYDTLQELVDKETPKKITIVKGINNALYFCPDCGSYLCEEPKLNYCSNCGQKLDWSDK